MFYLSETQQQKNKTLYFSENIQQMSVFFLFVNRILLITKY